MHRKILLCLFLLLSATFGFSQEADAKKIENPFAEGSAPWIYLLGSDLTSTFMPIRNGSVLSSLMNPSLAILNTSRTYEGNFMLLPGEGNSILVPEDVEPFRELFGFSVNGGASIPTEFGVFNASAHFLYSQARSLTIRPMFGFSFAYADVIPGTPVAVGGGIKAFFSKNLSDKTDYALLGDFGVTALIESEYVEDFYVAASLINMGYGSLIGKDSEQSFMPPFDLNFGLSFSYFRTEKVDLKFALNVFAPTFLNVLVTPEFDFYFLNLFGFRMATTADCLALAGKASYSEENRYGALLPSVGIYFRPTRTGNVTGTAGLVGRAVSKQMGVAGGSFSVTEGPEYEGLTIPSEEGDSEPKEEEPPLIEANFYIDEETMLRQKMLATYEQIPALTAVKEIHAIVIPDSDCELENLSVPLFVEDYSDLASATLDIYTQNSPDPVSSVPVNLASLKPVDYRPGWKSTDVIWESSDRFLPAGFYTAKVNGIRKNGAGAESNSVVFYLDPTLGFIKIFFDSVYETVLQPNKNGKNRTMELRQIGSYSEKWEYEIRNEFFPEALKGAIEKGRPKTFVWDGKNSENFLLPDGIYRYKIHTVTPRGYTLEAEYNNIIIENNFREMALVFWNSTYSKRSPSFKIKAELINTSPRPLKWMTTDVIDENLKTVYHTSEKEALKTGIIFFDGKDNDGKDLPPGRYRLRSVVSDDQGNIKTVISDPFLVIR